MTILNTKPKKPIVCILTYDKLCMFEFGIALEVFNLPRPDFENWYDCRIVAAENTEISTHGGIGITIQYNLDALKDASLIIIPGWQSIDGGVDDALKNALIVASENGCRIASICSGVFLLAKCGMLDGKSATTHWKYCQKLEDEYPNILVKPDILYVDAGNILTSAGSAAGLDLCLYIVREDFGSEIANQVARQLVIPSYREGGQAQYIPRPIPKLRGGKLSPLLDEIRQTLNQDWTIDEMSKKAGIAPRTLLRRFNQITGESPIIWLTKERLAYVRQL